MNSLKQDLEGKTIILDRQYLRPEYHAIEYRVFKVLAGFGMKPHTIGTALWGEFLSDGEQSRMEGYQVERIATDDEIALAQSVRK